MSVAAQKPMSLAEFLKWEDDQSLSYEFDGVSPVAMTGGTVRHARIQRNLAVALDGRLRGKRCEFLGSDLKIQTSEEHIRYPDGLIVCSPLTGDEKLIHDPVVIFEVLSPSTTRVDRFVKLREYQAMPSVQRYVMLEQDWIGATVSTRTGPTWVVEILTEDSVLAMPEIGVELPLAEFYQGLHFELPTAESDGAHPA